MGDRNEILRALSVILAPGQVTELRAVGCVCDGDWRTQGATWSGYYDDPEALASQAMRYRRGEGEDTGGVYIIPQPLAPVMLSQRRNASARAAAAANDSHVVSRRWLLVDVDVAQGAGLKIASTDLEHADALALAEHIAGDMAALGWPAPIVASSGNGAHLMWRVDLPADEAARQLAEDFLGELAKRYDDDGDPKTMPPGESALKIDRKVFNASRIWKLYGTPAWKGEASEDRPHRVARMVSVPEVLEVVPREMIEAFTAPAREAREIEARRRERRRARRTPSTNADDAARLRDALACLDASDHEVWIQYGMALHAWEGESGGDGFTLWDDWSQTAHNYSAKDVRKRWRSFNTSGNARGAVSVGSIFHAAKAAGWTPARVVQMDRYRRAAQPETVPVSAVVGGARVDPGDAVRAAPVVISEPAGHAPVVVPATPPAPRGALDPEERCESTESYLRVNRRGDPRPTLANALEVLVRDARLDGVFAWDEMRGGAVVRTPPPWSGGLFDPAPWRGERPVRDEDLSQLVAWLDRVYGLATSTDIAARALHAAAHRHSYHPVRAWLEALPACEADAGPDSETLLNTWLTRFLGVEDTPYARRVGRWWMISAVARAIQPGCKADAALVLEGPQGAGKSTAIAALCPRREWLLDSEIDPAKDARDAYQAIRGRWIVELAELDGLSRRSEAAAIKRFLSSTEDSYRPSYARFVVDVPRGCVFVGTVNEVDYLRDNTGNRRFWPVSCTTIDVAGLREARETLWSQALAAYRSDVHNVRRWTPTRGEVAMLTAEQDERRMRDPLLGRVAVRLQGRSRITMRELLDDVLEVPVAGQSHTLSVRLGTILRDLGWERRREGGGSRQRYYVRLDAASNPGHEGGPY